MHTPQLTQVEGTSGSGVIKLLNAECAITQNGYCCVFRKVHKCMLPYFDESESDALLARDWIGHSDGKKYLTRVQFQDAVFQHADAWTRSIEPNDYAEFLWNLLKKVASRNAGCTCPGNCRFRFGGGGFDGTIRGADGKIPGEHLDPRRAAHTKRNQHHWHQRKNSAVSIGGSLLNIVATREHALLPAFGLKEDDHLSYSSDYDVEDNDEEPAMPEVADVLGAVLAGEDGSHVTRRRRRSSILRRELAARAAAAEDQALVAAAAAAQAWDLADVNPGLESRREAADAESRAEAAAVKAFEASIIANPARQATIRHREVKLQHFAALMLQTRFRGFGARNAFALKLHAIVRIQSHFRLNATVHEAQLRQQAIQLLQSHARVKLARNGSQRRQDAVVRIQARARRQSAERVFDETRAAAISIQRGARGMISRRESRDKTPLHVAEMLPEGNGDADTLPEPSLELNVSFEPTDAPEKVEANTHANTSKAAPPTSTKPHSDPFYLPYWWQIADEQTRELYLRAMTTTPSSPRSKLPSLRLPGDSALRALRAERDETYVPPAKLPCFPNHAHGLGAAAADQSVETIVRLRSPRRKGKTMKPHERSHFHADPSQVHAPSQSRPSSAGGYSPRPTSALRRDVSPRCPTRPVSARTAPSRAVLAQPRPALMARPSSASSRFERPWSAGQRHNLPQWAADILVDS